MAIPTGVIVIWSGSNASIPAGWVRETTLDGKFSKVNLDASTNPNLTGGSATHTHTGTSHNHTMVSHTHTVSYGGSSGTNVDSGTSDDQGVANGHAHPGQSTGGPDTVSVSSVIPTYTAFSNNPPFFEVIFIKPVTTAGGLPDQAILLTDDAGFVNNTGKYNGYFNCDGNNSTPNIANKYLRGAGTGANAGTTGGTVTNVHTLSHTHTVSHNHANFATGISAGPFNNTTAGTADMAGRLHTHTTSIASSSNSTSDTPSVLTPESVEPAFKMLLALQNRSGTIYTPVGLIALWLGTLSAIPRNFELVTSMFDKHLKIGTITGNIGATGGSNTHTHTSSSHSHSAISHTHTGSTSTFSVEERHQDNGQGGVVNHNHAVSVSTDNFSLNSANTSADSSNNEPEFRTVALIKFKGETGGGFLFSVV